MEVWPSCPQACITPAFRDTKSWLLASWIGSASMSARMASTGPGPRPPVSRATTLVAVGRVISRLPNDARVSATNCEVLVS